MPCGTFSLYDDDREMKLTFDVSGTVNGGCPDAWETPGERPFVEDWSADRCTEIELTFRIGKREFKESHEPNHVKSVKLCEWLHANADRYGASILELLQATWERESTSGD